MQKEHKLKLINQLNAKQADGIKMNRKDRRLLNKLARTGLLVTVPTPTATTIDAPALPVV